jgi:hypothetical protein
MLKPSNDHPHCAELSLSGDILDEGHVTLGFKLNLKGPGLAPPGRATAGQARAFGLRVGTRATRASGFKFKVIIMMSAQFQVNGVPMPPSQG